MTINQRRATRHASSTLEAAGAPQAKLDRGTKLPTREMKRYIHMLELMLGIPSDHPLGTADPIARERMEQRLRMYRKELARRDARQDQANARQGAPSTFPRRSSAKPHGPF